MANSNRPKYEGITFREGYDCTFEQFQKTFEDTHVFKKYPEKERLAKMKEAFKVATGNTAKEVKESKEAAK